MLHEKIETSLDKASAASYNDIVINAWKGKGRMPKSSEAQLRAIRKFEKENVVQFLVKLNKNTDADVIRKLQSADSKQGYIKKLIRDDLK